MRNYLGWALRRYEGSVSLAQLIRNCCRSQRNMMRLAMKNDFDKKLDDKDLDRASRRSYGYWYTDGLGEIAIGVMFIVLGIVIGVQDFLLPPFSALSAFGIPVVFILGWWFGGRFVRAAKERITYPRTGFVAYKRPANKKRRAILSGVGGALMAFLVVTLALTYPLTSAWIPMLQGVLIGLLWFFLGRKADVIRFYLLAMISLVIGFLTARFVTGENFGTGVYFAAMGVVLVISGGITLWNYLHSHQLPEQDPL
jgi:hypothetical protein